MSAFYATGRLLWRPASLMLVVPIAFAAILSSLETANGPVDVVNGIRSRSLTPEVNAALWRFVTVFPVVLGLILSSVMRELQHTAFAWTLPDVSTRFRFGRTASGLVLSALLGALVAPVFEAPDVLAVFGWSLLCFALGGVTFDPALSKIESRGAAAILALVAFRPSYVAFVADIAPFVFAVTASAAAVALLHREFSKPIVRLRPHIPTMGGVPISPDHARQHWLRAPTRDVEWRGNLSAGGLVSWIRAGLYEGYGGYKVGWITAALAMLAITVTVGYVSGNPLMVVLFPWIFMEGRIHLQPKLLHPLSRTTKATLFFLSSIFESMRAAALGIAGLAGLYLVGYPLEKIAEVESVARAALVLLAFAAWAPVTHWTKLRGPFDATLTGKRARVHFGVNMLYVSLASVTALSLQYMAPSDQFALTAVTTLLFANHVVFWIAVHRHFARADLIVARA